MLLNDFYNGSLFDAVEKSLQYLDGDYAFAIYDGRDCVVVRTPWVLNQFIMVKIHLNSIYGFASERKALWSIGFKDVHTLPPDHILLNGVPKKLENRKIYPGIEKACADEPDNYNRIKRWVRCK